MAQQLDKGGVWAIQEKKKSAFEVLRSHVLAETGNGGPDEAEQERKAITKSCDELGLMIVEVSVIFGDGLIRDLNSLVWVCFPLGHFFLHVGME